MVSLLFSHVCHESQTENLGETSMLLEKIQRGHCLFSVFLRKDALPRDLQEIAGLTSVTIGDHQTAMKPRKDANPEAKQILLFLSESRR